MGRPGAGPTFVLCGARVGLAPLDCRLLAEYQTWINDPCVRRGRGVRAVFTLEAVEAWCDAAAGPSQVAFTLYDLSDLTPVGISELRDISPTFGTAGFAISLGLRRGQGLGTEATRLTLEWAFRVLCLHNVMLEVRDWNVAAITAYERAGFRSIGTRRGTTFTDGERGDELLMDAIPEIG
ncbi:MAG: GNAT family protein [Solirubrobacteraceae bacterium]